MYPIIPQVLPYSKFRHYRIKVADNNKITFIKLKKKIYTGIDLKKQLDLLSERYTILGVYQTISYWLNPQRLSNKTIKASQLPKSKRAELFLDNCFLGMDYLMDFDRKEFDTDEQLYTNIGNAYTKLFRLGFKNFKLIQTGHGYHLWTTDFNEWAKSGISISGNNRDLEYAYFGRLKKLTNILKQEGIVWDYKVSIDTRRIARTPNCIYENTDKAIKVIYTSGSYSEGKPDDMTSLITMRGG